MGAKQSNLAITNLAHASYLCDDLDKAFDKFVKLSEFTVLFKRGWGGGNAVVLEPAYIFCSSLHKSFKVLLWCYEKM